MFDKWKLLTLIHKYGTKKDPKTDDAIVKVMQNILDKYADRADKLQALELEKALARAKVIT